MCSIGHEVNAAEKSGCVTGTEYTKQFDKARDIHPPNLT